ncbi:hypothetical protein [Elioraea sp.]|uniref:hypothetical protein n=1 Tax=Elioraea sp. TaxID=2185103 RepID=UPI0025BF3A51|nr:hypothetical protein [Elioraea sp.]
MSPIVAQLPLPPALDSLVCSLKASHRSGVLSEDDLKLIVDQLHQARWYARVTGGRHATIAEVDLSVATERLANALTPQTERVPA